MLLWGLSKHSRQPSLFEASKCCEELEYAKLTTGRLESVKISRIKVIVQVSHNLQSKQSVSVTFRLISRSVFWAIKK